MLRHGRVPRSVRRGVTLMTAVVGLAVIAILAAAAIPVMSGYSELQRAVDTQAMLLSLQYSLVNSTAALGRTGLQPTMGANRFPGRLSQLIIPITTADRKCNTTTYGGGDPATWNTNAPYSGIYVVKGSGVGSGIISPIGMIRDTVLRPGSFTNAVPANNVAMAIDSVSDIDTKNLDLVIDGVSGTPATAGIVRWIVSPTAGAGFNYVFYTIPSTNC